MERNGCHGNSFVDLAQKHKNSLPKIINHRRVKQQAKVAVQPNEHEHFECAADFSSGSAERRHGQTKAERSGRYFVSENLTQEDMFSVRHALSYRIVCGEGSLKKLLAK
jgi:hypothetical protein